MSDVNCCLLSYRIINRLHLARRELLTSEALRLLSHELHIRFIADHEVQGYLFGLENQARKPRELHISMDRLKSERWQLECHQVTQVQVDHQSMILLNFSSLI